MLSSDTEEEFVVLAALLMLKLFGESRPTRSKVLEFVTTKKLMRFYPEDFIIRSTGDEAWANNLSWTREELKKKGRLEMPQIGIWKLSKAGQEMIEATAKDLLSFYETSPDKFRTEVAMFKRISEEMAMYLVRIARGEKWWLSPSSP